MLVPQAEAAGQLTTRSLTISSGVPDATSVTYSFTFTLHDYTADSPPGSMSSVQSMKFLACSNAVGTYPEGTCDTATGLDFSAATLTGQTGWAGSGTFSIDTTGVAGKCDPAANVLCIKRTEPATETATAHTIVLSGVHNPSTPNTSFYVGIYTYSDTGYATNVDFGATASAVVQTLTTAAAVVEVLNFCIGTTTIDDTVTQIADSCANLNGTAVNLGTLDTTLINISPWPDDGGNNQNGVAMVRSNAQNGTSVQYDAIPSDSVANGDTDHLGTLRLAAADCDPTNTQTDGCINAAGATINNFTASQEEFGMTVAGVNNGSTTSYTCAYGDTTNATSPIPAGNSCALEPTANYLGSGGSGTEDFLRAAGSGNGFAWVEDGTATTIASSSRAIDDEALILKFAATPSITTPFGPYTVKTDFIAVPTY